MMDSFIVGIAGLAGLLLLIAVRVPIATGAEPGTL